MQGPLAMLAGVWHTHCLDTAWQLREAGFHSTQLNPIKVLPQLQHRTGEEEIAAPTNPP